MIPVRTAILAWVCAACVSICALPQAGAESEGPSAKEKAAWRAALGVFAQFRESRKPAEREKAARAVADALHPGIHLKASQLLVSILSDEIRRGAEREEEVNYRVIEAAVAGIRKIRDEDASDWLAKLALDERQAWRVRFHVLEGLRASWNPRVVQALREASASKDERLRLAAVESLGALGAAAGLEVLLAALADGSWQIKLASVHALESMTLGPDQKERVTAALIEALRIVNDEGGRLKSEIAFALRTITGEKEAFDIASWDHWIAMKRRAKTDGPGAVTMPVVPTYHGVRIWSNRVVFVIDITGSMADPASESESTPGQTTPLPPLPPIVTGRPEEAKKRALLEKIQEIKKENDRRSVRSKMDAEKRELINSILFLDEMVHFTIVFYAELPVLWRPLLVPASPENKIDAAHEIEKIGPLGGTDIYKALLAAFAVPSLGGQKDLKERKGAAEAKTTGPGSPLEDMDAPADEIFLLTDGDPTVGVMTNTDRLCDEIRKINSVRKIRIHTIAVGLEGQGMSPVNLGFMSRLARENGGRFVHVK